MTQTTSPGSFSKNFGWHGHGLSKLYDAIRSAFQQSPGGVERSQFRSTCGVDDADQELIPINFFLHNTIVGNENRVSLDELVHQALSQTHSIAFDRLALFALHLNMAGQRRGAKNGEAAPATWANAFVRDALWRDGRWRPDALDKPIMDAFIDARLQAVPEVRKKCRSNYRHLYELCGFLPTSSPDVIDTKADRWGASALFLAWDRYHLDLGIRSPRPDSELIDWARANELYKLLGLSIEEFNLIAVSTASAYRQLNGLLRWTSYAAINQGHPTPPAVGGTTPPAPTAPNQSNTDWLARETEDELIISRVTRQVLAQNRDKKLADDMKRHYSYQCLFCDNRLQVAFNPDRHYAEAAHIKPLGVPHNGPDKSWNIIVLCPNHHLLLDRGVLGLKYDGNDLKITSNIERDPLDGKVISLIQPHRLEPTLLQWHQENIFRVVK